MNWKWRFLLFFFFLLFLLLFFFSDITSHTGNHTVTCQFLKIDFAIEYLKSRRRFSVAKKMWKLKRFFVIFFSFSLNFCISVRLIFIFIVILNWNVIKRMRVEFNSLFNIFIFIFNNYLKNRMKESMKYKWSKKWKILLK